MPDFEGIFAPQSSVVAAEMQRLNKNRAQPLTKFQQEQIRNAKPLYIYNVSSIHEWNRFQGQLGTVRIPKCQPGKLVSDPYILRGIIVRWYDKGLGRKEAFLESGMEVAEDIVGCSKDFPVEHPNNNLTNFGVFIAEKAFEELSKKEQERMHGEAVSRLKERLRSNILEGDQFWAGPTQMKGWIGKIHRDSLTALNEMEGTKEDRPWAPIRYAEHKDDCKFCGSAVKPGVPVCPNCRNILDEKKYNELSGKKAS